MSNNDGWGDDEEDDNLLAAVEYVENSFCEVISDDGDDDSMLLAAVEDVEKSLIEDEKVEVKGKADDDDYESLGISPPNQKEEAGLQHHFGLKKFKPLQWKIISSVMKERKG